MYEEPVGDSSDILADSTGVCGVQQHQADESSRSHLEQEEICKGGATATSLYCLSEAINRGI